MWGKKYRTRRKRTQKGRKKEEQEEKKIPNEAISMTNKKL